MTKGNSVAKMFIVSVILLSVSASIYVWYANSLPLDYSVQNILVPGWIYDSPILTVDIELLTRAHVTSIVCYHYNGTSKTEFVVMKVWRGDTMRLEIELPDSVKAGDIEYCVLLDGDVEIERFIKVGRYVAVYDGTRRYFRL